MGRRVLALIAMSTCDDKSDTTSSSFWEDSSGMEGELSRRSSYPEADKFRSGRRFSGFDGNLRRKSGSVSYHSQSYLQERWQCCRLRWYWTQQKWAESPLCPSWTSVARLLALLALGFMLWGNLFSLLGKLAGIDGQLFRIASLCVAAHLAGWLIHFSGLPPLLGMLLTGILLRNVGFVVLTKEYLTLAGNLRKMALVVILIRAGIGLDPAALKRLSWVVLRLSVFPSVFEAISVAVMTHFLLDLPWLWGCLLGSVLAAVSPAVVIPCSVHLQDKGYGKKKGIPTLIIAAASIDDINAISAFGVLLGTIFSTDDQTSQFLQGPLGLLIGLLSGIALGIFLRYIPSKKDEYVVTLRTILLTAGSLLLMFGIDALGYKGAGPLGCIVASFVACYGWRSQGWMEGNNPVGDNFVILWTIFQPILFGLIGTEINLFVLEGRTVGLGALSLLASAVVRMISSAFSVIGGNFNLKEKIFIAFAWFPKATVQAAIGPLAFDMARKLKMPVEENYGSQVLMIAVLSILLTAPIGAILITLLGPRLLHREKKHVTVIDKVEPIAAEALITNT